MRSLLLLSALALVASITYDNSEVIDADAQFLFYWTADTTNQILHVKLSINSLGWVGFGLSENGGMIGSDVFMAWSEAGVGVLHDRLAVQKAEPSLDVDNGGAEDWTLVSLVQSSGYTTIEANRVFVTGDSQDQDFTTGPQKLVFAWDPVAPAAGQAPLYHSGGRYPTTISLWGDGGGNGGIDNSTFPPDTQTGLMLMPGFAVPNTMTNYYCAGFDLANTTVSGPGQVIAFEPIIENPEVVHHMVIYICTKPMPPGPYDCTTMNAKCSNILYAWALGAPAFVLPEIAGFPFGPDSAQYAALQIHYDNVRGIEGLVDHSGVRIYYTQTPRPQEAGFIIFGANTWSIRLPPGKEDYELTGKCSSQDTRFLPTNLTLFASLLHMHTRGRQMWTEHYRSQELVGTVGDNKFFDFNFQQMTVFNTPIVVYPRDSFVTHCVYDTTAETAEVTGGESTQEEMCFNFVAYWPRMGTVYCASDAVYMSSTVRITPLVTLATALISALWLLM